MNGFFHRALVCSEEAAGRTQQGSCRAGLCCKGCARVPAKAAPAHITHPHHPTPACPEGISTFLPSPIITKCLQLQLDKTGASHSCKISYI